MATELLQLYSSHLDSCALNINLLYYFVSWKVLIPTFSPSYSWPIFLGLSLDDISSKPLYALLPEN